jgi:CDP-4-dehydro-6-deoxyglucose reductase
MSHRVSIWRAAQILGVPRGVLQQHVRAGRLELTDGLVATEALLCLYPEAQLEESGLLERVAQIRNDAFGKRLRERVLPSQEVLAQRVFAQSEELADVRRHLQRYHRLIVELQTRVSDLAARHDHDSEWRALGQQLRQGLAEVLATEPVNYLEVMDDMLKVMTAQVTVRPSGHQFAVEGHANLLQAGLHAGLKLNYGCGNGSCGMCKVRVISGDVQPIQHSDYQLSELEKAQGYSLMCCNTAASSEVVLEMLEAGGPQDIPLQEITAQVRAISELAPDTRLLHLQAPRTHRLRFLAGQSVDLAWAVSESTEAHAVHPVASCPCDDRNLLFFITRNAANDFASHLFAGDIRQGMSVTVRGPQGEFVLSESSRPLVFVACDAAFAPVKSLIEHALSLDAAPSLSLFWLATGGDGHFQKNLCRAWSEALDLFEYDLVSNRDVVSGAREIALAIRADLFNIDCDFYVAGPATFVGVLREELHAAGVNGEQVMTLVLE